MRWRAVIELIVAIGLCLSAGAIGSLFTMGSVDGWYETIRRPSFTPPDWLFAPVWTTLYVLMGISAWLLWRGLTRTDSARVRKLAAAALTAFLIQLVLNATWSIIFFGQHAIGLAFAELVVLWVAILVTVILAWRVSLAAALLLLPYLAWTTFAGILNYTLWRMNP